MGKSCPQEKKLCLGGQYYEMTHPNTGLHWYQNKPPKRIFEYVARWLEAEQWKFGLFQSFGSQCDGQLTSKSGQKCPKFQILRSEETLLYDTLLMLELIHILFN